MSEGKRVAALFVESTGCYASLPYVDAWAVERDARRYSGPLPVVTHPPCQLWVNLAAVNWKRYGRQRPAWYPGGTDGDCFLFAFLAIQKHGGVLEHPAFSHAFVAHGIPRPKGIGWQYVQTDPYTDLSMYVCEVWQSAYGHRARKRTWLVYVGARAPFELRWARNSGTAQIGWFDRVKPTLGKKEAIATPIAFRDELIKLAEHSRQQGD